MHKKLFTIVLVILLTLRGAAQSVFAAGDAESFYTEAEGLLRENHAREDTDISLLEAGNLENADAAILETDSSGDSGILLSGDDDPDDSDDSNENGGTTDPADPDDTDPVDLDDTDPDNPEEADPDNPDGEDEPDTYAIELEFDDRYSFEEGYSDYEIKSIEIETVEISSYQVSEGKNTGIPDTEILMPQEENPYAVTATGVGKAVVTLKVSDDSGEASDEGDDSSGEASDEGDDSSDEASDEGDDSSDEEYLEIRVEVTVTPAKLTLMYVAGQSNAEGYCQENLGYPRNYSIANEDGAVYSTYAPTDSYFSKLISGVEFENMCTADNASDFVAGSLTGETSVSGKALEYPLNSLTISGGGKTGMDSALAFEWRNLTGDKVWVVNAAKGASPITAWKKGGTNYERAKAIYEYAYSTYQAEISAGHYTEGNQLMFWLQGETDKLMSVSDYGTYFKSMYGGLEADCPYLDCIGVVSVRSAAGSYTNSDDLKMTAPRVVQYLAGASSDYPKLYVVSNVNEQWVNDSGVSGYFSKKYGAELSYPVHNGSLQVPAAVSEIHGDIHYSQAGHNENGLTAAEGIYNVLYEDVYVSGASWRNEDGEDISRMYLETGEEAAAVAVADPVWAGKEVSCEVSGQGASYDAAAGIVKGTKTGTAYLRAVSPESSILSSLAVYVDRWDLSDIVGGGYTGFYCFNDRYIYLENSIADFSQNGIYKDTAGAIGEKNAWYYVSAGEVRYDYTGFASNSNGDFYIVKGKVDFTACGVYKDAAGAIGEKNTWYYVSAGEVRYDYTGFASNSNGDFYVVKGKVDFTENSVYKDAAGAIGEKNTWYYVTASEVQYGYTGVANHKNDYGWWYIKNGKVDFTANTVAKNKYGWWYVKGGKVIFDYTGFASNANGDFYVKNGKVDFTVCGVYKDAAGAIGEKNTWYYVTANEVQYGYTGVANHKNDYGWWYIKNGKVDFTANTVAKNKYGWWYVVGGQVQFGYTGVANYKNDYGWWYIKGGQVDFSFTGRASNKNGTWNVVGGKVIF